jgi:serine-type D-Ala-D-Ala carboxypeptidase/endopeptidase (penicillin-binding protein 4)
VEHLGIHPAALFLRDGSGLTRHNLVAPEALVAALRYARARPWAPEFEDALARPGDARGTLRVRLAGHGDAVAAKTGAVRHVNGLAGYARASDGRVLVFSIMNNASGRPAPEVREAIDRIVQALLQSGS